MNNKSYDSIPSNVNQTDYCFQNPLELVISWVLIGIIAIGKVQYRQN